MIEKHGTTGGLRLVELTATANTNTHAPRPHQQAGKQASGTEGKAHGRNGAVLLRGCPMLHAQAPGRVKPRGALEARWEASTEERLLLHAEAAWGMGFMVLAAAVWLWLPDFISLSL